MKWSISSFKEFQKCERKWFLNHKMGSRSIKDAFRREIYLLSQLETLDSWRGQIVDYTISEYIIPRLLKKQLVSYNDIIVYAKELTRVRYNFASQERHKEPSLKKTEHYYEYAPLYDIEYPSEHLNSKLNKAWEEIAISLNNFINNDELIAQLQSANYLTAQRTLTYNAHGFSIQGVPDLIAFFPDAPPHIYDWKVHSSDTKTYTEQLLVYAQALTECLPHKDFVDYIEEYDMYDIRLSEVQLLTNKIRHYTVTEEYIERINDYIAGSMEIMKLKKCDFDFKELNIEDFEKTIQLDTCLNCQFKKICSEA